MGQHELLAEVNKHIQTWVNNVAGKLVVAIDGYTGVGKTTLANNLEKINQDILAVHQDDFLLPKKKIAELLEKAKDRSVVFEQQTRDQEKIEHLINCFRNDENTLVTKIFNSKTGEVDQEKIYDLTKKVLVIEGVFMFRPECLNHLWDKRIYLDGDIEAIDERRVKREKERWGKDYFPETHPDSHFRQITIALKKYREKCQPEKTADLVLSVD